MLGGPNLMEVTKPREGILNKDIVVFSILNESACYECGAALPRGRLLRLERAQPVCLECADRTAKRIQNSDLELQPRRFGEIVEGSSHNKCCQPLSVCHICLSPAWSLKSMLRWMLGLFLDETTTCASDKPI